MTVVVTGGAGFIGSHLAELLITLGHKVVVFDNFRRGNKIPLRVLRDRNLSIVRGDVRVADEVLSVLNCADVCIHLAALLGVDDVAGAPIETMEIEVIGMKNVADACVFHGVKKILYASTSGVYGDVNIDRPVDEDDVQYPKSSYSVAKRFNEIFLKALWVEKGIGSVSLRYFNVCGPRQDQRMVVPRFFAQALEGSPITVYGDGTQTRNFTSVRDSAAMTVALMKVGGCHVVNVSSREEVSILEVAHRIKELTHSNSEIVNVPAPIERKDFEVRRRTGSSKRLESLVGASPKDDLDLILNDFYKHLIERR